VDTAKAVFQLHGVDGAGKAVLKRKLRRSEWSFSLRSFPPARSYWKRAALGHDLKLIAPEAVRPFVKKGKKNDPADAAALVTAASQPDMKFVPVKDTEQQGILSLHTARALLVKQQTMLANAVRGLAAEFGHTAAKGMDKLTELVTTVEADEGLPARARQAIIGLYDQCRALDESIATLEAEIVAHARHDERARRLATIPGVGPITSSMVVATVTDFSMFKSARHLGRSGAAAKRHGREDAAREKSQRRATNRYERCWCRERRRWSAGQGIDHNPTGAASKS
jgi:error-prone DNA polymerase